jgi:hypothetical protein
MRNLPVFVLAVTAAAPLALAGCAAPGGYMAARSPVASVPDANQAGGGARARGSEGAPAAAPAIPPAAMPRKIIYTTEIDLVAETLAGAERELGRLVKQAGGYLAETEISGSPGSPRQGRWRARVPVGRFDTFVAAVTRLGELQNIHTNSQDVSEEYYDLEARLANKRVEEQRLLKHLTHSTARLEEILAVERELSRVRGEIEQMEGRRKMLASVADLATVTITVHEVKDYAPPKAAGLGAQVGRTFHESVSLLGEFLKGLVLCAVGLAPWALVTALVALPLWLFLRRRRALRAVHSRDQF